MDSIINHLKQFVRTTNYLSAAQIYLINNFFLKQPLNFNDIKPRLLGHWGASSGWKWE